MISTDGPNKIFTFDLNTFCYYFALEKLEKRQKKKKIPSPQHPIKKKRGFFYCMNKKKIYLWVDLVCILWLNYLLVRNKDVIPETKS